MQDRSKLTASQLRQNIYRILDQIIESGESIEIERNGNLLEIKPVRKRLNKLERLKKRKLTDEDSDNFIHIDWSGEWCDNPQCPTFSID